jgi:hypothetical protein
MLIRFLAVYARYACPWLPMNAGYLAAYAGYACLAGYFGWLQILACCVGCLLLCLAEYTGLLSLVAGYLCCLAMLAGRLC